MGLKGARVKDSKRWKQFLVAAVASALASVFIVAVGPGFSSPNENAAEQAVEATSEETEVTTTEETEVTTTENEAYVPDPDTTPGGGDDIEENASTKADSHGHVGAGTGTSTGSQADPAHQTKAENEPRGKVSDTCTNKHQGADEPQGGANENPGPYDNTCDGDASENGIGDGSAKGRPCAGCVGNADDKNPPGQVKEFNGKKANDMGYECDGNRGIGAHYGRGNPAHTGDCQPGTTTPPTTEYEVVCRQNAAGQWEKVTIVKGTRQSTDLDADSPLCKKGGGGGGDSKTIYVCRPATDGTWSVVGPISPKDKLPGDTVTEKGTLPAQCGSGGGGNPDSKKVTICHYTGSATNPYVIITVSENALKNGHDETHGELNPRDASLCVPTTPISVCRNIGGTWTIVHNTTFQEGDRAVNAPQCQSSNPPLTDVCRNVDGTWTIVRNTTFQPGDRPANAEECENEVLPLTDVCRNVEGMWTIVRNTTLQPGDKAVNAEECEDEVLPEFFCPADSDMPGMPVPPGGVKDCYDDVKGKQYCPPGTDMAGQPIPPGGIADCDDDVKGTITVDDKDDVGSGGDSKSRKPLGGVLPFTGTSILAYVLVALQMIGAGALILRGRKAKK